MLIVLIVLAVIAIVLGFALLAGVYCALILASRVDDEMERGKKG